jgi:DNA-binding response OmpR family regulator
MIVDDDRTTVRLMQSLLELDGFEVAVVPRGLDVLPALTRFQPHAMVLDYHLSDIDGVEVIRQIRGEPAFVSLPIIMASGLDVEREAMEAGATQFLIKPMDPGQLSSTLKRLTAHAG